MCPSLPHAPATPPATPPSCHFFLRLCPFSTPLCQVRIYFFPPLVQNPEKCHPKSFSRSDSPVRPLNLSLNRQFPHPTPEFVFMCEYVFVFLNAMIVSCLSLSLPSSSFPSSLTLCPTTFYGTQEHSRQQHRETTKLPSSNTHTHTHTPHTTHAMELALLMVPNRISDFWQTAQHHSSIFFEKKTNQTKQNKGPASST